MKNVKNNIYMLKKMSKNTFFLTYSKKQSTIITEVIPLERRIYEELLQWKNDKSLTKMPLLLYGARQIGKTYIIEEFGKNEYKNMVYLNFEKDVTLDVLFQDNISPDVLLPKIEQYFNTKITIGETLLFFDEIQASNRALTALKYFCEENPNIDIIAAGSLLGVHLEAEKFSFPVGKVYTKTMYPLNFEEFLLASDKKIFAQAIREAFENNTPLPNELHNSLMELYKTYMIVGGMPFVTQNYLDNPGVDIKQLQELILNTYTSDMNKYADKSQSVKNVSTYNSILPQLAKENKKFQYKLIAKGARASLFGDSIDWLVRAGVAIIVNKINAGDGPLEMVKDLSSFKLYMNDIGLCSCKAGITWNNYDIYNPIYLGGIIENYVATNLLANNYELYYWASEGEAEVDFVINKEGLNIPIEVKKSANTKSRSLEIYMKKYKPQYAIRISARNFGFENNVKSVPLYAVYLI